MIRGAYIFRGRILTDGGTDILEAGIEISQTLGFQDSHVHLSQLDGDKYQVKLNNLEPGTHYYYRAFASNQVGETKGTRKRLKIPALPQPTALVGKYAGCRKWMDGVPLVWNFSKFEETEWIYHTKLGWIYAPPIAKMVFGFGWNEKAGCGPEEKFGLISGKMIQDLGFTSMETARTEGQSFLITPVNSGVKRIMLLFLNLRLVPEAIGIIQSCHFAQQ